MRGAIGTGGKVGAIWACWCTQDPDWDVGRGKTKKQKKSKRKSGAHSPNSNRAGNWWLPFVLRDLYSKQCWVPAFPVSFFAQLLEGICVGSSGLGKEPARELCSFLPLSNPCRALDQTILESAVVAAIDPFGTENQVISLPSGREARPFSNLKVKLAWVSQELFNRQK